MNTNETPDAVIRRLSNGRLRLGELHQLSGLSRASLRNWTLNPKRQRALDLLIRGALGVRHEAE